LVLPALSSSIIIIRYKEKLIKDATYIANIHAPRIPALSGMVPIVTIDKNNNSKVVINNCAPYYITIDRNDVLCIIDLEHYNLTLMEDLVISTILSEIHEKLPKLPKNKFYLEKIEQIEHLNNSNEYKKDYIDIVLKLQEAISAYQLDLGLAKNYT
jgi:hypothetical protein